MVFVKRNLNQEAKQKINQLIHESIQYAFTNPGSSWNYVKQHSQEMSDAVCRSHIALYVNNFSIALNSEGKNAIELLLKKGFETGILPEIKENIFLNL